MKEKILIIEDDPAIQVQLKILLSGNGYDVESVKDFTNPMGAFQVVCTSPCPFGHQTPGDQRTIGRLFFAETFLMGLVSIAAGIFLGVWFGLPVVVAVLDSAVVIAYFLQTVSAEITAYIGLGALTAQIAVTVGILVLLMACYFLSTWLLFRKAIGTAPDRGALPT